MLRLKYSLMLYIDTQYNADLHQGTTISFLWISFKNCYSSYMTVVGPKRDGGVRKNSSCYQSNRFVIVGSIDVIIRWIRRWHLYGGDSNKPCFNEMVLYYFNKFTCWLYELNCCHCWFYTKHKCFVKNKHPSGWRLQAVCARAFTAVTSSFILQDAHSDTASDQLVHVIFVTTKFDKFPFIMTFSKYLHP